MSNANEIIESICQADVGYIDVGVFWHRLYWRGHIVCGALQHVFSFEENLETIFVDVKDLCQKPFDAEWEEKSSAWSHHYDMSHHEISLGYFMS